MRLALQLMRNLQGLPSRLRLPLLIVFSHCAVAADQASGPEHEVDTRPLGKTFVYSCGDLRVTTRVGPGEMALWLPGEYHVLSREYSASGVRYREGDTEFWVKGEEAMLNWHGQRYRFCRRQPQLEAWADARRRGMAFRAQGQDPDWQLEIEQDGRLHLSSADGAMKFSALVPVQDGAGDVRRYQFADAGQQLRVEILAEDCRDPTMEEALPAKVSVMLDGKLVRGCGQDLQD